MRSEARIVRRLSIHFEISFGQDEPEQGQRETQFDAMVERARLDDVSPRSEMDSRRIGFSRLEHA
jgi:hypothetical protein